MSARLFKFRLIAPWLCLCAALSLSPRFARGEDFEFFEQRIRPLLADNCYKCHSSAGEKVKGGLLLDTREGLLKGGDSGPAIVPGDPEHSLLIKAVRYIDKDLQMPPKGRRLAQNQVDDLVSWVKAGAPDPRAGSEKTPGPGPQKSPYDFAAARKQWAFHAPEDPPVPAVKEAAWVKSPIDNFILSKLEETNLRPRAARKQTDAHSPRYIRFDWTAADAQRSAGFPQR